MSVVTLDPTADGNYSGWTEVGAGAGHWDRVSDDNDANYIHHNANRASFLVRSLLSQSITSVKGRWRGLRNADDDDFFQLFSRIGGVDSADTGNLGTGEMLGVFAWIAAPTAFPHPTAAWSAADLESGTSEFGVQASVTDHNVQVSEFEVVVDYVPVSGMFLSIIASLLGAIGSGLTLGHMPALISAFNRSQRKTFIFGHEAQQLYTDLVSNPHRRFVWQS